MAVRETSAAAYRDLPMSHLQDLVLDVLKHHYDRTNQEIAREIGRDASTVSGVNVPMRKAGLIVESRKRVCDVTGRTVIAWRLVQVAGQQQLI